MRLFIVTIFSFFLTTTFAESSSSSQNSFWLDVAHKFKEGFISFLKAGNPTDENAGFPSSNLQHYDVPAKNINSFQGVRGPLNKTVIAQPAPTSYTIYNQGGDSRIAILLTDTDSYWLGLAHGLKSMGIPFIITRDYQEALRHKVIFVYPNISTLPPQAIQALINFPQQGGTLIAQNITDPNLMATFGFKRSQLSNNNKEIHFNTNVAVASDLIEPEEKVITVAGDAGLADKRYKYFSYLDPTETPVATFADGTTAISHKTFSHGHAYAFGIDLGRFLLNSYNGLEGNRSSPNNIANYYVNHYEPISDVLLHIIKNIYLQGQGNAITLSPVPHGKSLAVIFTHDLDYSGSVKNAPAYAELEQKEGVKGTYFVETKYVRDWNDYAFFDQAGLQKYKQLQALGMELGSEAVSHSLQFDSFPLGSGMEQYPDYLPYVRNLAITYNGAVLGELRVSRFLIQHFFPEEQVISFRPGYLRYPRSLPEALTATGYRYVSSVTANDSLTHLPFQVNYHREPNSELPLYEFPVTIEDQAPPAMLDRLPQALDVAKKISRFGGIYVILNHPNILGQKLEFEKRFIESRPKDTTWYGTLGEFGNWWSARDKVGIDISENGNLVTAKITAPLPIAGLTLNIPTNLSFVSSEPANLHITQQGHQIIIDQASGTMKLIFKKV